MNYSPQQIKIFDAVQNTDSNIVVSATAGAGKSTTLVKCGELIPRYKSSIFIAFNKSIVEELKQKLPNNIQCSTIHSLGAKSIFAHFRAKINIFENKTFILSEPFAKKVKFDTKTKDKDSVIYRFNIQSIVDFLRGTLTEPTQENIIKICDKYGISPIRSEIEDSIEVFKNLQKYNRSLDSGRGMIDFTDMIYLPVFLDMKLPKYDVVLLDEAQDFSNCQKAFADKITNKGGRQIIVGDPRQAIYGFTGSEVLGFNQYEKKENTLKFPLSVCYRCAKSIIEKAREVYTEIEPFEGQIDGEVIYGVDLFDNANIGDLVICRNTKPLIVAYFGFLKVGKKAGIAGRDIEKGLLDLITPMKGFTVEELNLYLVDKLEDSKTSLEQRGVKKPESHQSIISLMEKIEVVKVIQDGIKTVNSLIEKTKSIFIEQEQEIKLMSIHKSKGLEADNVFLIDRFEGEKLLPSKHAKDEESLIQEKNLEFVAYTRAKNKLFIINI